jgi:hypothetical protein
MRGPPRSCARQRDGVGTLLAEPRVILAYLFEHADPARILAVCVAISIVSGCGFTSECENPNPYRVLALDEKDKVFERRDARIRCLQWTDGCSDATVAPGDPPRTPLDPRCSCLRYTLVAGDFQIEFPPTAVGRTTTLSSGVTFTITKANQRATSCAQGDYYVDYSGTFEGTVAGRAYHRGVFYALDEAHR